MPPAKTLEAPAEVARPLPMIGVSLLAYHATSPAGLGAPCAATVVGTNPATPDKVNIVTFHERTSQFPVCHPVDGATFCLTDEELATATAKGNKWVCKPCDPLNPVPYAKAPDRDPPKRK